MEYLINKIEYELLKLNVMQQDPISSYDQVKDQTSLFILTNVSGPKVKLFRSEYEPHLHHLSFIPWEEQNQFSAKFEFTVQFE